MSDSIIQLEEPQLALPLFGPRDQHLRVIRELLDVSITHREGEVRISGEPEAVEQAVQTLEHLKSVAMRRGIVSPDDVSLVLAQVTGNESLRPLTAIDITHSIKKIRPRTPGQARYTDCLLYTSHGRSERSHHYQADD